MHKLLVRQLERALGESQTALLKSHPAWEALITLVDDAYQAADADREFNERSMDMASKELVQRNGDLTLNNEKLERAKQELRQSHDELERRVAERTAELSAARDQAEAARQELAGVNAQLEQRVKDRTAELEAAHARLVDAAHRAGRAEIATSVLHNVGNVLNSVNVSAGVVGEHLQRSPVDKLVKAVGMISDRRADLGDFLIRDEKGKQLPAYLEMVSAFMQRETSSALVELRALAKNIEHIKHVISAQQENANTSSLIEDVDIRKLLDDALNVSIFPQDIKSIRVEKDYRTTRTTTTDRHMVLQILINLIGNAKHALRASSQDLKKIILRLCLEECEGTSCLRIEITDNGVGIPADNLSRIFNHGFTTKKGGHGFGLHGSANAARRLGGTLEAQSAGQNCGATFILKLPVKSVLSGV